MNNRFPTPKGFIAPTLSLVALMGLACWLPMRIAAQTQPPTPPNTTPDKTTKTDTKSDMNTDGSKSDMKTDKKPDQKNNGQSDKNDSQSDKNKDDKSGLKPGDTPGRREAPNPVILNDDHLPHILTPNSKSTLKDHQDHTDSGRPEGPKGKDLPLYGYDFFKPQRDAIEQYRAFVKQLREEQLRMRSGIYPAPMNNGNNGMGNNGTPGNPNETNLQNPGNGSLGNINPSQLSSLTPAQIAALPPGLLNNAGQANTPRSGGTPVSGATGSNPITDGNSSLDSGGNQGFANPGNTFQGTPYRSGDPNSQPVFNAFNQTVDPITAMLFPVNATPPADYKLGPGDSIKIQYSSPTLDNTVTIDRSIEANGSVMIGQGLAPVNLTGKTLEAAEKALTTQLRRYYNNVQVNITLNRLRTIQVTISGKAYLPGSYSVPAVATAYNMVYASGGPTEEGTLRGIQVRRQGRIIATLDMYKFEQGLQGDPDVPLQSGDIIVIPPHKSRISISGEVLSENVFELLPEESLADALNFAGGVKPSAVSQRIQISSVDPGQDRIIRDVDLKKPGADKTTVYDGDFVSVLSVRALFANTVKIEGAVDQPSDYALTPGMKVSDLLERARGLLNEAFPIADLHRWQPDNTDAMKRIDLVKALAHDPENDVVLTKWDRIKVYTRDEVAWTGHRIVTVNGAVKKYGTYTHSQNMRVSDLLRMAGGPMPDAYLERAILIHQHDDGPPSLEYVNLNAVIKGDKDKDLLLQDNDNLAVYAVGQAQFTPDHVVQVQGQVVAPGSYPRAENMRLSDLLILSGGFRPDAGSKVVITHARRVVDTANTSKTTPANLISVTVQFDSHGKCAPQDDLHLEDGDVVTIQGVGGFLDHVQTITVNGAVNSPGAIPLTSKNMRLSDALKQAGGLRPEAFPQGAEFSRDPKMLETSSQRSLAVSIGSLNDLLNDSEYLRDRARAQLEVITATGQAAEDAAGGLAGLAGASSAGATAAQLSAGTVGAQIHGGDLVTPARRMGAQQIEPDGHIAINLTGALHKPQGPDDIVLQDGDAITVPETPTTVQVIGAVYNQRGVLFQPGKSLQKYVDEAGGYAPDAAKDRLEVIRVGGGIIAGNKVRQIQPGDVIVVPNKVLAASIARHSNGINDFFKSLTSSVLVYKLATSLFGL